MFATLLGALPRPPLGDTVPAGTAAELDALVELAIRAQEAAGLEPITDGRLRDPGFERLAAALGAVAGDASAASSGGRGNPATLPGSGSAGGRPESATVEGWRFAAGLTDRAVKQALLGPYTLGRLGMDPPRPVSEKARLLMGTAKGLERERRRERERDRDRGRRTLAIADALHS